MWRPNRNIQGMCQLMFFSAIRYHNQTLRTFIKTVQPRCHTAVRQNSFSSRVINERNKLPQEAVEATSINAFKNRLGGHWKYMNRPLQLTGSTAHQPLVQVSG